MTKQSTSKYRVTFILDTRGYQEPVETLIAKLKSTIEAIHGAIKEVRNLGVRDFTRAASRKFTAGHYVQFDFNAPTTAPQALKEKLALDRTVNRMLVESL